jgi:hypothetical protein
MNYPRTLTKTGSYLVLTLSFLSLSKARTSNYVYETRNVKTENSFYGKWRITNWICKGVAALTGEEANAYIGTSISFQPELAANFGDSCTSPDYKIDTVNTDEYLNNEYPEINRKDFNISTDKIIVITITCKSQPTKKSRSSPNFDYMFIKVDDQRGIIEYNGVEFFLTKVDSLIR